MASVDDWDDDRFSLLPEPIIHHIFSYLRSRDVLKMAAVCKSLAQARATFPILEFDTYVFLVSEADEAETVPYIYSQMEQRLSRMRDFIDATMSRFRDQGLGIEKFKFYYTEDQYRFTREHWADPLERWIGIAIDNRIREIVVRFKNVHLPLNPSRILSAPFLQSLELANVKLLMSPDVPMNLDSLRSLTLRGYCYNQETLDRFVSSCRSLEFLSLEEFEDVLGRKYCFKIRISGFPNIKKVKLPSVVYPWPGLPFPELTPVEIEAPSLESLCYGGIFGFASVTPALIFVNHSPNLKRLELSNLDFSGEWLEEFLSRFPLLEELCISEVESSLKRIKISNNPCIRRLDILHCNGLTGINLETSKLKQFPSISLKNLPGSKWQASMSLRTNAVLAWNDDLKEFLAGAHKCFTDVTLEIIANHEHPELSVRICGEHNINSQEDWRGFVSSILSLHCPEDEDEYDLSTRSSCSRK